MVQYGPYSFGCKRPEEGLGGRRFSLARVYAGTRSVGARDHVAHAVHGVHRPEARAAVLAVEERRRRRRHSRG